MKVKKIPQRMCVACQQMKNKKELMRVVCTPESEVYIDPSGKKSGRGSYVCLDAECINKAKKLKALERTLKVAVPEDIYQELLTKAEDKNNAAT